MATHPDYSFAHSFVSKGKTYWRFRKKGHQDQMLPGEPHSREFDAKYYAITEDRPFAQVIKLQGLDTKPETFKHAYQLLKKKTEWKDLQLKSQRNYSCVIEQLLLHKVEGGAFGDAPVAELRRRHVLTILQDFSEGATREWRMLIVLRKLLEVGFDQEWITVDPTDKIKRAPDTVGHKTWGAEHMAKFEEHWPIGTPQRTAYALGLWLGNRVSDIATLRWDHHFVTKEIMWQEKLITVEGFEFVMHKGRNGENPKTLFLPMTPMLARQIIRKGRNPYVVPNGNYDRGYNIDSLSQAMSRWSRQAGLPTGYTMHGLRKALAVKLAHADATTRQLMEVLGHTNIAFAALYSKEADQVRMAYAGMDKVTKMEQARNPHLKLVG